VFPAKADLPAYTFYFDYFPNHWMKQTGKRYVRDCLMMQKPTLQTLYRYNYSLRHFFQFARESDISMETFADVNRAVVDRFLLYLLSVIPAPSTRRVALASLKHLLRHGQRFEWAGFPAINLFDGTEFRTVQTEDVLKSHLIPDTLLEQIQQALTTPAQHDQDVLAHALIRICMDTGVRLSEALALHENSVVADLVGKPLLEVIGEKNTTDRFIAISQSVVQTVERVRQHTQQGRAVLKTSRLFVYYPERKQQFEFVKQSTARRWLGRFVRRHAIRDSDGTLVDLHYHQFRHTLGTDMLNNGMSPYEVMAYLGHKSLHSTKLYAKVRSDRLTREYKKLGVIGIITKKVEDVLEPTGRLDSGTLHAAALPDGICSKPLNNEGTACKNFNLCLFCQKYITTPEHLPAHRAHLQRIRADKARYMIENLMGSTHHLDQVEQALEQIICRLEELGGNER